MRFVLLIVFFGFVSLALRAQGDVSYCGLKADNSKAKKTKYTLSKKIKSNIFHGVDYLGAETWMRTRIPYESWEHISKRLQSDIVAKSMFSPRTSGQPSLLYEQGYRDEMAKALQKPFGFQLEQGNQIDLLVDGPASFTKRKELIDQAQESIYMFAWAFYDDGTGWEFADWLINAKLKRLCEGADLDIKIIVDGNVAKWFGYRDVLKYIESYPFPKSPIRIVRLKDPSDPYFGMHRKEMIFDRKVMVMGGLNVGNKYSHMYTGGQGEWRDTDVLVRGSVVNQAQRTFVEEWNEQVGRKDLNYSPYDFSDSVAGASSFLVDHRPLRDDNMYIINLKAFYGATKFIDIENAYFVLDPVIEQALVDALKRGVKVRILSNSKESIDEPVITVPILQSLAKLKKLGAEVFTKKVYGGSTTMHSKLLIVDGVFTWIGSHNFHPRSYRYEREVALASFNEALANQFELVFEDDISSLKANKPTLQELEGVKVSKKNKVVNSQFFDQL